MRTIQSLSIGLFAGALSLPACVRSVAHHWPNDIGGCKQAYLRAEAALEGDTAAQREKAFKTLRTLTRRVRASRGLKFFPASCAQASEKLVREVTARWRRRGGRHARPASELDLEYLRTFRSSAYRSVIVGRRAALIEPAWKKNQDDPALTRQLAELKLALAESRKPPGASADHEQMRRAAATLAARLWLKVYGTGRLQASAKRPPGSRPKLQCRQIGGATRCRASYPEVALRGDARQLAAALRAALKLNPTGKDAYRQRFLLGILHWQHNFFRLAAPLLQKVVTEPGPGGPKLARRAARVVLDILVAQKRFPALRIFVGALSAAKNLMAAAAFARYVHGFLLKVRYHEASEMMKAERFGDCARAFEGMVRDKRIAMAGPKQIPTLLWNAAVCAERAGQTAKAFGLRKELVTSHRRSRLRARAMLALAQARQGHGGFAEAATWYEKMVADYPNHVETGGAHLWAIILRAGQVETAKVEALVRSFVQRHAKRAATAAWLLVSYYEALGMLAKWEPALRRYLKDYGRQGPAHRTIEGHVKLAELHGKRSCPRPLTRGLCLSRALVGSDDLGGAVVARKSAELSKMKRHLRIALRAWGGGKATARLRPTPNPAPSAWTARQFAARATLRIADLELERTMPALGKALRTFFGAPAARRKLEKWIGRVAQDLSRAYQRVMAVRHQSAPDSRWSLTAVARQGALTERISRLARTGPRTPAARASLQTVRRVLREKARTAYALCLKAARRVRWWNRWATFCEARRAALEPEQVSALLELWPAALRFDSPPPAKPVPAASIASPPVTRLSAMTWRAALYLARPKKSAQDRLRGEFVLGQAIALVRRLAPRGCKPLAKPLRLTVARFYNLRAVLLARRGRHSQAARILETAVACDPTHLPVLWNAAVIALRQRRFRFAHTAAAQLVARSPKDARGPLMLGVAARGLATADARTRAGKPPAHWFATAGSAYRRALKLSAVKAAAAQLNLAYLEIVQARREKTRPARRRRLAPARAALLRYLRTGRPKPAQRALVRRLQSTIARLFRLP